MGSISMWVIISIVALVADIMTSSFFIAGFTIGGIFAILALTLGCSIVEQIAVFSVVSAGAIMVEYIWFRKKLKKSIPKTLRMEEEYVGMTVTADQDIEESGRMKVGGIYWTVINSGDKINKGEKAKIVGIKGNKLIIKREAL